VLYATAVIYATAVLYATAVPSQSWAEGEAVLAAKLFWGQ
jgi:hypothetical protein